MPSLTSWFMTGVTTSWLGSLSSIRCHPASAHLQSSAAQCSCGWCVRLEAGGGGVPVVVEQDEGDVGLLPRGGRDLLLLVEPPAAQPRGLLEAEQSESGKQRQGRQSEAGSHPPLLELSKAGAGSVPAYCGEAEAAAARGARRAARIIVFFAGEQAAAGRQEDR